MTVYRDCNECKIAGGGGGSNTKDCDNVYLYLRSSNINGCNSKELGKLGYEKLSPRAYFEKSTSLEQAH